MLNKHAEQIIRLYTQPVIINDRANHESDSYTLEDY